MFEIFEATSPFTKRLISSALSLELAMDQVRAMGDVVCMEVDEDFGDCADAYLADGRLIVIEPRKV